MWWYACNVTACLVKAEVALTCQCIMGPKDRGDPQQEPTRDDHANRHPVHIPGVQQEYVGSMRSLASLSLIPLKASTHCCSQPCMLLTLWCHGTQVGIRCVRLEGSMSMEARDRMISAFTNEPGVTVFLMSLKAGGVALNLTAASHVMLMDPWCACLTILPSHRSSCWLLFLRDSGLTTPT